MTADRKHVRVAFKRASCGVVALACFAGVLGSSAMRAAAADQKATAGTSEAQPQAAVPPKLTTDPKDSEALVGVAAIDVTPDYPVRLSGFGGRRAESEGVTHKIWVKALAIGEDAKSAAVLLTVDNLGVPDWMSQQVAKRLHEKLGLDPRRLSITYTHAHTAPMLRGAAATIFGVPTPPEHQANIDKYTEQMAGWLEAAATKAIESRVRSRLSWSVGRATFAINRRGGSAIDHDLPVLFVHDLDGKPRAVYTSYACHCVTFGHNKISGDWAGYAAEAIEKLLPGAVAMVSIGCGADQNPSSGVTSGDVEKAMAQGREIGEEIKRLAALPTRPIKGRVDVGYKRIDLPLAAVPNREEWERRAADANGWIAFHAKTQIARLDRGEPLRTEVAYPVQTWAFGDDLAMVFLAGEVVVDYSLRLKRELDRSRVWIHGYANEYPCYIPSERVLREGGYEGGDSMIYFDMPSRFVPGLEKKIIDAVHEVTPDTFNATHNATKTGGTSPLSPERSLAAIRTRPEMTVELVAAEPLVVDPVAIDFGADGRLWVAEMHDYPAGVDGKYSPGGRVKLLSDTDGDGRYDRVSTFLDRIPFPTGVTVWHNGVLVCTAPDILYAEDTDNDGQADVVKKLFTGFATHNYQARVNSLHYGLDNWVYASTGLFGGKITGFTGNAVDLTSRDFRMKPATGEIEPVTGQTQQSRVRDDWDNWFGCDSGTLIRHYPVVDRYVRRNPQFAPPATAINVADYPNSNRLFPISPLVTFKLSGPPGFVTAACGLGIYRDELLGREFTGNAFTCEPVCQVVHRLVLSPRGSTFRGRRAPDEQQSEFLASTDNWFRPVQARTGPDGALYVVDMYRYVIEHPVWIPPEVLATLDVRAGDTRGRIYRVFPNNRRPRPIARLDKLDTAGLVAALDSPNGPQRDLAQQMLVDLGDRAAAQPLDRLARESLRPQTRLQALCALDGLDALSAKLIEHTLRDEHPGVRRHAIRLAERFADKPTNLIATLSKMTADADAQVRIQLAYTLGEFGDDEAASSLAALAFASADEAYVVAAAMSSLRASNVRPFARRLLSLSASRHAQPPAQLLSALLAMDVAAGNAQLWSEMLQAAAADAAQPPSDWQFAVLARLLSARDRNAAAKSQPVSKDAQRRIDRLLSAARHCVADADAELTLRLAALPTLGFGDNATAAADRQLLADLLSPRQTVKLQLAAVAQLDAVAAATAPQLLLDRWPACSPVVRAAILDVLLIRPAGQQALLDALERESLTAGDLDATRRQRLLESADDAVRARAAKRLSQTTNTDRSQLIEQYVSAVSAKGEATKGQAVFAKTCATCHRLGNVGVAVGPDLAPLASKPRQTLLAAVLDPNQAVDPRYVSYQALTDAGLSVSGLLSGETATSIVLTAQDGKQHTLLRTEIDEFKSTGKSLMPEGLEKDISPSQMADLLAFLATAATLAETIAFAPPADVAAQVLDDQTPAAQRERLIADNHHQAVALIAAMTADLPAAVPANAVPADAVPADAVPADAAAADAKGKTEEYRRIPWIWRVAIAAGRRNDAAQLKAVLAVSLPDEKQPLCDWQAVVIGGGVINGLSQAGAWPRQRIGEILAKDEPLAARWRRAVELAAAMTDDEKTPTGTRYDALRMLGVDTWDKRGRQIVEYLAPKTNAELQMGAVSALADVDEPPAAAALAARLAGLTPGNRNLALDALLRNADRAMLMLDEVASGRLSAETLGADRIKRLKHHDNAEVRRRAAEVVP